ncbi:MAG: insulinase family protein [Deltaproteobacteria bacterium]|nr:MAG: insulinase family protein [Deltaproteobacteria bacterium]
MRNRTRSYRNALLVAVVTAAALPAAAGTPAAPAPQLQLPEVKTWTLDNGLRVAYLPRHEAPVVAVHVWYHVGSKEERPDRLGAAHMFEHMLFKGTVHVRPEEHARHIQRVGGSLNAFTTQDTTAYHEQLPKQYLQFACKLEAERMRNLLLRKEMIDTEREVVKEELRLRYENSPIGKGLQKFFATAFTKHPYGWLAIGTKETLDATDKDYLQYFYDTYYVPNNALLVVVGDVSEDEVRTCADTYFAKIPRGKEPPRPADERPEPPQTEKRRVVVEPRQIGIVLGGFHIPEAKHPDMYPLRVLAKILSDGESSRLYRRLVRTDKIAVAAGGQVFALEHPGLFLTFGVYLQPDQGDKVEAALLDEIAKVRDAGVTDKELQKAKNQLESDLVFSLESASGLATQIGQSWINTGDPAAFLGDADKIAAVTADDVQRVARQYLVESNLTIVVIPPKGGAK